MLGESDLTRWLEDEGAREAGAERQQQDVLHVISQLGLDPRTEAARGAQVSIRLGEAGAAGPVKRHGQLGLHAGGWMKLVGGGQDPSTLAILQESGVLADAERVRLDGPATGAGSEPSSAPYACLLVDMREPPLAITDKAAS